MKRVFEMFKDLKQKLQNKKTLAIVISVAAAVLLAVTALILILTLGNGGNDDDPSKTEWPEAGVYYFDAGYDEYTLTLNAGNSFALIYKGESFSGTYTLTDGALTLDFFAEGKDNVSATFADNVVTMTYEGASMRLLKKINYTVSFETNGGSSISAVTVINGKSAVKPADPTREGHVFVGWYADAEFTRPFAFGAEPITADTTVYARWSERSADGAEYELRFELGYDGAVTPEPLRTAGGKVFGLPSAEREGYTFFGWWISMEKDASKLSYRCTEGMAIDANTTLYALWQQNVTGNQLFAPAVNVAPGSISWDAVSGARSYSVSIIGPDGETVLSETTGSTTVNVPFADYPKGEYTVTVVANAATGDANNTVCTRYYTNKALRSVSVFNVVGSTLIFNTVENAEKYLITVVCGNKDHNHTNFDNATSRTFSFANCDMPEEGIRFTVTAIADGYAPSRSDVFTYKRSLGAVSNIRTDAADELLRWDEVADAEYYMVSVKCGNSAHEHGYVNCGTKTQISLKECSALDGGITVKIYPVAKGYSSPAATEFKYTKTALAAPSGLAVSGALLTWGAVDGAAGYEIAIGDKTYTATSCSYDLSSLLGSAYGSVFEITVRAKGTADSLFSDPMRVILGEMGELRYSESILSWDPILGADSYELQVNGGEIIPVSSGSSTSVILTQAGVNLLKVRYVDGISRSEWVSLEVFAHTVTFDTLGGSPIVVQYKAVGDRIELPTPTKDGYTFVNWYNVPGGPSSNGLVYRDEFFAGSGSLVLYANYTPNKYALTYNFGAGGSAGTATGEVLYEQHYKLAVPTPHSPTGAFGGWFSATDGKGVQYTDSEGKSLAPWGLTSGAEVFAYWIDETLSFTLSQVNGRSGYVVSAGARTVLVSEITVPSSYMGLPVLMVAGNAFKDCTNLKIINLPETIEQISLIDPFAGCVNLEQINVKSASGARYWSEDGVLFDNAADASGGASLAYMPLAKRGTYRIPSGVSRIPDQAFRGSGLSKIIIPVSVTKIADAAFLNCASLTSIVFEVAGVSEAEQPLSIGKRVFDDCAALESITLPARLTDISLTKYVISGGRVVTEGVDNAFTGCDALVSVNVAPGNKKYESRDGIIYSKGGSVLYYCPTTLSGAVTVPTTVTSIAPGAFIGCSGITEVTVSNTVTEIGECAFYGLDITRVAFQSGRFRDISIGRYAFRNCVRLSDFSTSCSRIAVLGEGAFYGCESLTSFAVPASMTEIGKDAFRECRGLLSITFAENGKSLRFGENVFYNCTSLSEVHLPANISEIPGIFGGCVALTKVTVNNSPYFTSVGDVLFNKDITEIIFFPQGKVGVYEIPATVTKIADGVFKGISGLDKIIIPSTVTEIGDEAFSGSNIGRIEFGGAAVGESLTIGASAFERAKGLSAITLPSSTKHIGDYAFSASDLVLTSMPSGLESIGSYAFSHVSGISAITIPAGVGAIGDHAFYLCPNLDSVTLSEGLESIGDYAFSQVGDDSRFKQITIPASVTSIGNYAFAKGNLSSITFAQGSKLRTVGAHAFDSTALTSVTLPKSVVSVGAYAFYASSVQQVTFENGGTEPLVIGTEYTYTYQDHYTGALVTATELGYVFAGTESLTSVVFPKNLVELKASSFESAGSSTGLSVSFGTESSLKTIGDGCFRESSLSSITIPKSVSNLSPIVGNELGLTYDRLGIGKEAFFGCDALSSVEFEQGGTEPLTIGANAFYGTVITAIALPARLATYTCYTGETVSGLAGGVSGLDGVGMLASIEVDEGSSLYADVNGVLYNADLTRLILCPRGKSGSVSIAASTAVIENRAFHGCVFLSAITFEGGAADLVIGDEAFRGCTGISELVLPANTVSLGDSVFYGCTTLASLTLPSKLTNFNGSMIANCPALKNIQVSDGGANIFSDGGVIYTADRSTLLYYPVSREDASYTVLPGVTVISASAFSGNTFLEAVILPAGLREIGSGAFLGCTKLTTVNIPNSVEVINEKAFSGCTALTAFTFEKKGSVSLMIDDSAFESSGIGSVELPARLTSLGDSVFLNSALSSITFEENSRLTSIGNTVFQCTALKNVVFPDGIITIGSYTFNGCDELVSVTFGEGLQSLGDNTFGKALDTSTYYPTVIAEASGVSHVHFPASLVALGVDTFSGCAGIENVTFASGSMLKSLPNGTFYESGIREFTVPSGIKDMADKDESDFNCHGVFEKALLLERIIFESGSSCTRIGAKAFHGCTSLSDIEIPASVSTVGASAFRSCTALEALTIPETTTQLGESIFEDCTALESITLNTRTTELPARMFYGCTSLESIVIPSTVSKLGADAFKLSGIAEASIEGGSGGLAVIDGVIYDAALRTLITGLPRSATSRITVPASVTAVSAGAFSNNNSIREVIFADGGSAALVIEDSAFSDCHRLASVALPERLTTIGEDAFIRCYDLTHITIPSTVTAVGEYTFYHCYKLIEVCNRSRFNIRAKDHSNGYVAFYARNVYTPNSGESIINIDSDGFVTAELTITDRVFNDSTLRYEDVTTTYKYLVGYAGDGSEITLPESFDAFYDYTFYNNTYLTGIVIPAGAGRAAMRYDVFSGCDGLSIFLKDTSASAAWGESWSSERPVIFGYDGEEHTYSFEVSGGAAIDPVKSKYAIQLPIPTHPDESMTFGGWYDNEALMGAPLSGSYYSPDKTVLYASWLTPEDLAAGGTSYEDSIALKLGKTVSVSIDEGGKEVYFKFTATETGFYHVHLTGSDRLVIKVMDDPEADQYYYYDYEASYTDEVIDKDLSRSWTAGQEYYVIISLGYTFYTGELQFTLTYGE